MRHAFTRLAAPARAALAALLGLAGLAAPARAQEVAATPIPGLEGRAGLVVSSMRLLTSVDGEVPVQYDGAVTGLEFLGWLPKRRLGLHASFQGGDGPPAGGRYSAVALTGLYGSQPLALEVGYHRRALYNEDSQRDLDRPFNLLRLGGRGTTPLGTTPFALSLRGALMTPLSTDFDKGASGFELESEMRWLPRTTRISAAVGYRFERLKVEKAEQEVGYVTLGLAYHFGGER